MGGRLMDITLDKQHKYCVDGVRFKAVTKFIKSFFPVFDEAGISAKYAKKHGMKQEDVIKMWRQKGQAAASFGNYIHHYANYAAMGKPTKKPRDKIDHDYFKRVDWVLSTLKKRFTVKAAEMKVASHKWRLAGTVDLVMENHNSILIADWKNIIKLDEYNPWDRPFYPIEHLQATNTNQYKLQLDIYRNILMETIPGKKIYLKLIHLMEDGVKIIPVDPMPETRTILGMRISEPFA